MRIAVLIMFALSYTRIYGTDFYVTDKDDVSRIINHAHKGDRIIFRNGTYRLSKIEMTKPLTLEGERGVIIDGLGQGSIFVIKSDSVTIKNMTIRNSGFSYIEDRAAVKVFKSHYSFIENCVITNCFMGIHMLESENCFIRNNTITGTAINETQTGNAIYLFTCKNITVENNNAQKHRDGIYIEFSTDSKFRRNTCMHNIRYGLHFMFSHNNEYARNNFSENGAGVAVMYSRNIYMHDNIFADNWSAIANGLLLKDIKDSRIERNIIKRNTVGVYAEGVMRTSISDNDIASNGWGLRILGDSEDNKIENNNFVANTFEVVTNATVNKNKFYENYWSNYSGYDLNHDSFGDIPHSPVKLFTYIIEEVPAAVILMRSLFIDILDLSEKITPVLTPANLTDTKPRMHKIVWSK